MRSAPPKTLGGYRTQNFTPPVTGGAPNNFPMHLNRRAGNIPLFIRCGAYRTRNSKFYPPRYWGGPKQFPNAFE